MEEVASSTYVEMNRTDLQYQPPQKERSDKRSKEYFVDEDRYSKNERVENKIDWATVRYAREALFEEYATANHFCKGIIEEFSDICRQGPEAILSHAQSMGLI